MYTSSREREKKSSTPDLYNSIWISNAMSFNERSKSIPFGATLIGQFLYIQLIERYRKSKQIAKWKLNTWCSNSYKLGRVFGHSSEKDSSPNNKNFLGMGAENHFFIQIM